MTQEATGGPATFLIGIGNSGRRDDGLGWAFLERAENAGTFNGRVEYRYQLQVEDAALIRDARRVIFVDACREPLDGGFRLTRCMPSREFEYTSHVLPPQAVLQICLDLYGSAPPAELLLIQGEDWGLGLGLSHPARENLGRAVDFIRTEVSGQPPPGPNRPATDPQR